MRLAQPDRRVWLAAGATRVVVPVRIDGTPPPPCPAVSTATGTPLPAELVRIGIDYADDHAVHWMGRPGTWTLRPAADPRAPDLGAWLIAIDLSAVAEPGSAHPLRVGIAPVALRTTDARAERGSALLSEAARRALRPVADDFPARSALADLLAPMHASPAQRWRAAPLLAAIRGDSAALRPDEAPGTVRTRRPGDGAAEALARQTEAAWATALGTLASADAALAAAVADHLLTLVPCAADDSGPRPHALRVAPVWPTDEDGLDRLLTDLCDERLTPAAVASRARAWLTALGPPPESLAVSPAEPRPTPIAPPGFNSAPFEPDWTMASWSRAHRGQAPPPTGSARAQAVLDPWATAAFIGRDGTTGRLCVWVEARSDPAHTPPPAPEVGPSQPPTLDSVSVWWGSERERLPRTSSTIESRVTDVNPEFAAATVRERSRTLHRFWVPDSALGPDGLLRIAITRTDVRGRRSAWPRPCLPWQLAPASAAFDLATWPHPRDMRPQPFPGLGP